MKNNKKKGFLKGVIPWIIAGFIFGLISGIMGIIDVKINVEIIVKAIGYCSFAISIFLIIVGSIIILGSKRKIKEAKVDEYEKIETNVDYATVFTGISLVLMFLAGGIFFYFEKFVEEFNILKIIFILIFSTVCFLTSYLQYVIVNVIKKMNPEKKGNPLETNFAKDWYSSCDEIQKQIIGEVCYKTYLLTNSIFIFAFLVLIILNTVINIEISAILTLGAVNLINNIIYGVYCIKIEHKKEISK